MGAGPAGLLGLWMVALSGYDIRWQRLPNWLTLPGAAAVLAYAATVGRGLPALTGATVLVAVYLVVHLAAPAGFGAGDVKLALGLGALTGLFGAEVWVLAAVAAPLLTAMWALAANIVWGARTVPHGPSMCLSSALSMALAVFGSPG